MLEVSVTNGQLDVDKKIPSGLVQHEFVRVEQKEKNTEVVVPEPRRSMWRGFVEGFVAQDMAMDLGTREHVGAYTRQGNSA